MKTDVMIAGGGPVGLMLALGLAQAGQKTVLAERFEPSDDAEQAQNSFDGRVLALSYGSVQELKKLGLWADLKPFMAPIEHVHVSQKGYLGIMKMHARESGVEALGYSIQSSDLGRVLWRAVRTNDAIRILCPAELKDFSQDQKRVNAVVKLSDGETCEIESRLLVGADGTQSRVRKVLGLPIREKAYQACGVLAQVRTEQAHNGWSYERFTEEGPVALLPLGTHDHKAVLVCPEQKVESVMALSDEQFIDLFAAKMGERLGAFTQVSHRVVYPLKESYVEQMVSGRAVLMGNASHTQHPVAAQGLNLGVRDVADFLDAFASVADPGDPALLERYRQKRQQDHEAVMGMTDGLIQLFQHRSPLVGHLRGLGLMALQGLPGLKKRFAKFAMKGKSYESVG